MENAYTINLDNETLENIKTCLDSLNRQEHTSQKQIDKCLNLIQILSNESGKIFWRTQTMATMV